MAQQTAVEWLQQQYNSGNGFERLLTESEFEQAKAMEKQQIVDTHYHARIFEREYQSVKLYKDTAEQYYKEKYGE